MLATSLLLLCAAATSSSRIGGFSAADEPVDDRSARDAAGCRLPARFEGRIVCSPWHAAVQTAQAMGLGATIEPALADMDAGRWAGRSFEAIETAEPGALAAWLGDPTLGAPGGETMAAARRRVGIWIDEIAGSAAPLCAIGHPMIVRAALSHMLGFPLASTLGIDLAPLSRIRLSFNRVWRLQALEP